jgi:predicted ATPase
VKAVAATLTAAATCSQIPESFHIISTSGASPTVSKQNRYIITGGPSTGKTTLIEALRLQGYNCVDESARAVINQQIELNTGLVPWIDNARFSELVLDSVIANYKATASSETVFFDRGVADVMAYLILDGIEVPQRFWDATRNYRFNTTVFMLPQWEEIYANDSARVESFELASRVSKTLADLYTKIGYDVVELPKSTTAERLVFLLDAIAVPADS